MLILTLTLERLHRVTVSYQQQLTMLKQVRSYSPRAQSINKVQSSNQLWLKQSQAISKYYADSTKFEQFAREKQWIAPYFIAKLISQGPLKNKNLDILDIGCHHGNLINAINDLNKEGIELKIRSYSGIDLSQSATEVARRNNPQYEFTTGDALEADAYNSIRSYSKNLIVCCGVCDYLTPKKIEALLQNLEQVLSHDNFARIYLTYRTTKPQSETNTFIERKLPLVTRRTFNENGFLFYGFPDPGQEDLTLLSYDPEDFNKIASNCGFEIEKNNSISCLSVLHLLGSDYDYVCLKRKKLR